MAERQLLGGRYELDGVVGRGGMAEVYRARDLRLGRVVAVKTLRSDLSGDPVLAEPAAADTVVTWVSESSRPTR